MLSKYFNEYQSQEDQDYKPSNLQQQQYRRQRQLKKKKIRAQKSARQLYQELKQQINLKNKKIKINQELEDPLQTANKILNNQSLKPSKRVVFAGKQFMLNQQTGQLQIIQKKVNIQNIQTQNIEQSPEEIQRMKNHISYQYLNHVMRAIYNRSRKINSVGKSKLDWKGFVRQEGIQDKLKYNRKGGVIQDMQFIKKVQNTAI